MTKCLRCGKEVTERISSKGKSYKANPDGSPHNINVGGQWRCANNRAEVEQLKPQNIAVTTQSPETMNISNNLATQVSPENQEILRKFVKLHDDAFLHCFQLAKRRTTGDDRTVEIVTNGYLHDFFQFYSTITNNK